MTATCLHCRHPFHACHVEDDRPFVTAFERATRKCVDCRSCWPPDDVAAPRERVREQVPA